MVKKIFIYANWTCPRRKIDGKKLAKYFSVNNKIIVYDPRKADIIILITCSQSNERREKCVSLIQKFKNYKAELIVAGCMPAIDPERLKEVFEGRTNITKEIDKIDELFPEHKIKFNEIPDANETWNTRDMTKFPDPIKSLFKEAKIIEKINGSIKEHIRNNEFLSKNVFLWKSPSVYSSLKDSYVIRPSWGCLGNCTYCSIKKAIGGLKSKDLETVIFELKNGLKKGYNNIILDADDLGCYGVDIGISFAELLEKMTDINNEIRLDLHNIHPRWLVKNIDSIEKFVRTGNIRRIFSSIQSGNPRILKLMKRYHDIEKIKDAYLQIKQANPQILLETEVICGFPSETNEEFKDTLNVIDEIHFTFGAVNPFSLKKNTGAEKIEPKIDNQEIINRVKYAKKRFKEKGYKSGYVVYFRKWSHGMLKFVDTEEINRAFKKTP